MTMKRRTFLKLMAGGVAAALSPAFLNLTRIPDPEHDGHEYVGTVTIRKLDADGNQIGEEITSENRVVDEGINSYAFAEVPYEGRRQSFRYPLGSLNGPITEVGVNMNGLPIYRHQLSETITVLPEQTLDVVYEHRRV